MFGLRKHLERQHVPPLQGSGCGEKPMLYKYFVPNGTG